MKLLSVGDLVIGDVVVFSLNNNPDNGPFAEMTVANKTEHEVTLFRVYVSLADFTYTGGVITYIGTETIKILSNSPSRFFLKDNIYRGLETPTEWAKMEGIEIVDPDGWKVNGVPVDFDKRINRKEWEKRRNESTISRLTNRP